MVLLTLCLLLVVALEARYNQSTTDAGEVDTDTKNFGVKFTMGAMTVFGSTGESG